MNDVEKTDPASKSSVEIQILGQKMALKSDSPEYIAKLASYVQQKVDEVASQGALPTSKRVLLAALNIADDYFQSEDHSEQFRAHVVERSRAMLKELDA